MCFTTDFCYNFRIKEDNDGTGVDAVLGAMYFSKQILVLLMGLYIFIYKQNICFVSKKTVLYAYC